MDKITQKVFSYAKNEVFMNAAPFGEILIPLQANNERLVFSCSSVMLIK